MIKKKRYLFVWENVLSDYTSGMAFAVAPDYETALKLINKKRGYDLCLPLDNCTKIPLTKNYGNYIYGGG